MRTASIPRLLRSSGAVLARSDSRRGAAVVEMALAMPLLVILVFGTIDFGLLIYNKAVVTNAAREGARAGIVYAPTPTATQLTDLQIQNVVTHYAAAYLIRFGSPALSISDVAIARTPDATAVPGTELRVTVTYAHQFVAIGELIRIIPGATSLTNVTLASTAVMRME